MSDIIDLKGKPLTREDLERSIEVMVNNPYGQDFPIRMSLPQMFNLWQLNPGWLPRGPTGWCWGEMVEAFASGFDWQNQEKAKRVAQDWVDGMKAYNKRRQRKVKAGVRRRKRGIR